MKNYPRIHSLSTVGLIHHHENDYEFHSTRTDFMGDSASGKSIIADLLQLIFVGSVAFKSATATLKDKRDPDGLVLTTPGKGMNIGYALLNIAVDDEQFVVIGAYLESTSKYTKPFIVQASTEIENEKLSPISTPLMASDFKNGDDIYDIEELYEAMERKQLVFKKWDRIGSYHRILYNNNILPLDLAASDKTLNDYAKIIQSFSRGKTLNTRESKSLIDFLFGNERANELHEKYIQIVKDIETSILSYGQNIDAINLLTKKYKKVCDLKLLLKAKNTSEKDYNTENLLYHHREVCRLSNGIQTDTQKIINASYCLNKLIEIAKTDIAYAQQEKSKIDKKVENAFNYYIEAKRNSDILGRAKDLLHKLNVEIQDLELVYNDYQNKREHYLNLKELRLKLFDKKLITFFEQSEWLNGLKVGNEYFGKRIGEIELNFKQLSLLLEYTDINNPNSLVRWAISLNRPLTKCEESIIMHFQTLTRIEPSNPTKESRYIPSPEILFEKLHPEERNNGFWLDMKGVREYVPYVVEQQLNVVDKDEIGKYFESQNLNIAAQKIELQQEATNLRELNTILSELSKASDAIDIYKCKDKLNDFKEIEFLNIDKEVINSYLQCLKHKDLVEKEYHIANKLYQKALVEQAGNNLIIEKLPIKINKVIEQLKVIEYNKALLSDIASVILLNEPIECDLKFYLNSNEKVETFETEFEFQKDDISLVKDLGDRKGKYDSLKLNLLKLECEFKSLYQFLPCDDNKILLTHQIIENKRDVYIKEKAKYEKEFQDIVDDFIPSESYKFETVDMDFVYLISNLLPDIFDNTKIIEEEVISKIENHLKQINNKNRDLNSKKIQKIENLFDDLQTLIGNQADMVRKINRFFNDGEKKISGNYKLCLDNKPVNNFPIQWLSDFKYSTGDRLNLFDISIADKLSASVSIEEKIVCAFRELTNNKDKDITIKDLLNPNSYMELSLDMHDIHGKSNKGSTGQTYAAIASLCIARLSIVGGKYYGKEQGLRFMPIDEAEGLGSNFELLYEIAQKYDYQIVTFAINPLGRYDEQYIYILHRNADAGINVNYTPMAIHSRTDINDDSRQYITS